jgi:hypothetical protein
MKTAVNYKLQIESINLHETWSTSLYLPITSQSFEDKYIFQSIDSATINVDALAFASPKAYGIASLRAQPKKRRVAACRRLPLQAQRTRRKRGKRNFLPLGG